MTYKIEIFVKAANQEEALKEKMEILRQYWYIVWDQWSYLLIEFQYLEKEEVDSLMEEINELVSWTHTEIVLKEVE